MHSGTSISTFLVYGKPQTINRHNFFYSFTRANLHVYMYSPELHDCSCWQMKSIRLDVGGCAICYRHRSNRLLTAAPTDWHDWFICLIRALHDLAARTLTDDWILIDRSRLSHRYTFHTEIIAEYRRHETDDTIRYEMLFKHEFGSWHKQLIICCHSLVVKVAHTRLPSVGFRS